MNKTATDKTSTDKATPSARERVSLHKGADGIAVVAEPARFGAVRIGDLRPGVEYVVAPAEAGRLITNKRFDCVDPAHRDAAIAAFTGAATAAKPKE